MSVARSLNDIGLRNKTDKASQSHDFLHWYEKSLSSWRDRSFLMIEIGIYDGASLATWGEYFQMAKIVGVDIDPRCADYAHLPNTHAVIKDGSRLENLDEIIATHGKPSIVLDDGSHFWHHQIETLRYLWPRLLPGGIYIMEDIDTSFPGLAEGYGGHSSISAYNFLLKLQWWVVGNRAVLPTDRPDDGFVSSYWPTIESMHFYRGTCIMQKK